MDNLRYAEYTKSKEVNFEALCHNCGECCGSLDDPCRNLLKKDDGTHSCRDYSNRFGPQKTVSGKDFDCVFIREHIASNTLRPNCGYR